MRTGPWESPMIFTPAPMIVRSPTTTSPVISAVGNRVADAATVGRMSRYAYSWPIGMASCRFSIVTAVGGGTERSPSRSAVRRRMSSAEADRTTRAGRPTATTSLGSVVPPGTRVPSPRNTRSPTRAPGMRIEAFPISQRSPTVAPITLQRCPNVVRRPMTVGISEVPMTTEFSITADPVPTSTPVPEERTTAPWASSDPSPRRAVPSTTAECAICTESERTASSALPGPALIRRTLPVGRGCRAAGRPRSRTSRARRPTTH